MRERLLMDFGWKFHLGNEWGIAQNLAKAGTGSGPASTSFSDASWRTVNLPHDWAIELPFDRNADASHGFKPLGPRLPQNSVAWYRRTFELPREDAGKRIWLEFDGVFRDSTVFVNGWFVGNHQSGYSSFRYDITDVANCGGKNVLAVKVDASDFEGWFYEGAGIYRHVWLVKTAPVAIAPDGTFVYSEFKNNVPKGPRRSTSRPGSIMPDSTKLPRRFSARSSGRMARAWRRPRKRPAWLRVRSMTKKWTRPFAMPDPVLWSPESPQLYKLDHDGAGGRRRG